MGTREHGATLVEFAIVMPLLVLMLVGILEIGMAFKDFLSVSHAAREGARVAAFTGTDPQADCLALAAVVNAVGTADVGRIVLVQVYRADSKGDPIVSDTNTYTYTSGDPLKCTNWSSTVTWPSPSRQTVVGATPLDIVGVRVELNRSWITGFAPFRGAYVVDQRSILRLEPEAYS